MTNKRPLMFLGIAIAIAFAIVLIERPERLRVNDASEEYLVPGFDISKVERFEVEQLVDGATLKREGDGWVVSEFATPMRRTVDEKEGREDPGESWKKADRSRVSSALGIFSALEKGILVSDNPQKQTIYRVSDAVGLKVSMFDKEGKPIADIVIGKNGPDFASAYVRQAGDNKVYLVRRPIVGQFSPRAEDWREKTDKQ